VPTYTYVCTDCDEHLEVVQSFTSDPLTECPRCGGRLRKVFHPVGVLFKGSGFYRTDSRSSGTSASTSAPDTGTGAATTGTPATSSGGEGSGSSTKSAPSSTSSSS